jgi:HD-GYP domain-containing protein (c-di-GMP phosphodiesterase class II)
VQTVLEFLGMDVAFSSSFTGGRQVFEALAGEGAQFGVEPGGSRPLDETLCQRIVTGGLPQVIPDLQKVDGLPADLQGAFVSVPIVQADGSLHGTLCAISREPREDLTTRDLPVLHMVARLVADRLDLAAAEQQTRALEMQAAAARVLAGVLQGRDGAPAKRPLRIARLASAVARQLELEPAEIADVEQVALLCRIGKALVPEEVLGRHGPLTEAEWELVRGHPARGEALLRVAPELAHIASAVRAVQEHWDGGGYPDGLTRERIPLAARIAHVCTAYDAMVCGRPYRAAIPAGQAAEQLAAGAGGQFCPLCTHALLQVLERGADGEG